MGLLREMRALLRESPLLTISQDALAAFRHSVRTKPVPGSVEDAEAVRKGVRQLSRDDLQAALRMFGSREKRRMPEFERTFQALRAEKQRRNM